MTASADRRRRFTIVGAGLAAVGVVALIVISVVAVTTLRGSREGRAPEVETREVVMFPNTPNAVIGVVDDLDRLTSIAVLTLEPSGVGGSIVVVPVNVDQTNGFGPERLPVSRQPYTPGDPDQAAELVSELEPLLTLTLEQVTVAGPDELSALLEPLAPFDVELSDTVVDSDSSGSGTVVRSGEATLDTVDMVDSLTAIDGSGDSYDHHASDVELWEAIAASAGSDVEAPMDDDDRPIPPETFDELWKRLFAGDVGVRPLDIDESNARAADNETDADFVLVDRPDALLIFGGVSPGLVSTPNDALTLSLKVGFDDDEVSELGDAVDGTPITKVSMTRRFINELLFARANVVGVDLATDPDGVPAQTQLLVADESMEDVVRALSARFFGDAEVLVSEWLIDGIDVVVVLGTDFLEQRDEFLTIEREQAAEAEAESQEADFDLSETPNDAESDEGDTVDSPVPDTSSDTVVDDG
ncbi:hypothetical protein [Ilumatobacter sp.]|uniref:hypothetical protein n=1 Tax=Ilumatobacter sp. TaxID=1967498 RepID=UPI003C51461D